jgi:transposase
MSQPKKSQASSRRSSVRRSKSAAKSVEPGQRAQAPGLTLQSYEVGGLPLLQQILERMQLERLLQQYLPKDDPRCEFPTSRALVVLVQNVLVSRAPVYAVGEWAAQYAPDLLNMWPEQVALLHDDRLGRGLTRLFAGTSPELILAVVRHVIEEFQVGLDELHNDSTTVSFYGAYSEAAEEGRRLGRATHAITFGHSKDHRPDLKQLLYTLTVSDDGGLPLYFTSASGNVVDDQTHQATWDLLCQLVGGPDFLYVADCKLASAENLGYIAQRHGRFVTVMPRTHGEDQQFRAQLRASPDTIRWQAVYDVTDEEGQLLDRLSVCADELLSWALDPAALAEAEREDGIFPLLSNDRQLTAEEVLRAYKRQPLIEKRFSQFKTDFAVAPVYLKDIGRIQGLLAVYFFVLLVQTLLERELRRAMAREKLESLPLYPEDRPCTRPTTYRVIEVFKPIQRHVLSVGDAEPQFLVTELSPLHRQILRLLGLSPNDYGL